MAIQKRNPVLEEYLKKKGYKNIWLQTFGSLIYATKGKKQFVLHEDFLGSDYKIGAHP